MNIELWYSVSNGGDGSAYPVFFATEKEARTHQEGVNANEGWAEDCYGCITITRDDDLNFTIPQSAVGYDQETYDGIYPEGKDSSSVAILDIG